MATSTSRIIRRLARKTLSRLGYSVVPLHHDPTMTLLGLQNAPFSTIVDVGANVGQFAQMAKRIFPNASIISFEPLPEAFEALSTYANGLDGLEAVNAAVGERNGQIEMLEHSTHTPSSSILERTRVCTELYPFTEEQRKRIVRIVTLDAFFDERPIALSPILLKLDVQGYEDRVLRGAGRFLSRVDACIVEVAVASLYRDQSDFFTIASLLSQAGLQYAGNLDQIYGRDGEVLYLDAVFKRFSVS